MILLTMHGPVISVGKKVLLQLKVQKELAVELSQMLPGT